MAGEPLLSAGLWQSPLRDARSEPAAVLRGQSAAATPPRLLRSALVLCRPHQVSVDHDGHEGELLADNSAAVLLLRDV
eukprot:491491-Prymnesium_polylepis.1